MGAQFEHPLAPVGHDRPSPKSEADAQRAQLALDTMTGMHFFRARTLLCFGERLRRDRRRKDARERLRAALEVFDELDARPWAERAAAELVATGEPGQRSPIAIGELTPQEMQIAVLVADGQRNAEISRTLFLSVRTVEFHLSRVYAKLGVRSRTELGARLNRRSSAGLTAGAHRAQQPVQAEPGYAAGCAGDQ